MSPCRVATCRTCRGFVQHKFAPHTKQALEFYGAIDGELGRLLAMQVLVGVTADHGMNDKPHIVYLQQELDAHFAAESATKNIRLRVVCAITDPYVAHHGSLGSLVYVHIEYVGDGSLDGADFEEGREAVMAHIEALSHIEAVYCRDSAMAVLQLPYHRIGDITVIADKHAAIGKAPEQHELSHVSHGLRSHGGSSEQMVPFILSRPLNEKYAERVKRRELRNFNVFEFVCMERNE